MPMTSRHYSSWVRVIQMVRPFKHLVPNRMVSAFEPAIQEAQMQTNKAEGVLTRFREEFADVEGMLMPSTEVVWDFLLGMQNKLGMAGNAFEIGVYKGRTAFLAALYLKKGEKILLADIANVSAVGARLTAMGVENLVYEGKSSNINLNVFREYRGTVRWFHIDGDHSGFATSTDLALAASFLGDRGIICVDDFMNEIYPQLCAEVYRFLFQNPTFKMLLSGRGKCYIVRSEDYATYESYIREGLALHTKLWEAGIVVSKTSYAHDMGCWTVSPGQSDGINRGRDAAPTDVPF